MRTCKIWLGILAIAVLPAWAQSDNDQSKKRAAVQELFVVRGEDKILEALMKSQAADYAARMQQLHPEISPDRIEALRQGIEENLKATESTYLAHQTELYVQRLSFEDLQAAISFYKTPEGRKIAAISIDMLPDSAKYHAEWVAGAIHEATKKMNNDTKAPQ